MKIKTIEYKKIEDLIQKASENSLRISDIILEDQSSALEETKEHCFERMQEHLNVMLEAIDKGTNPDIRSTMGKIVAAPTAGSCGILPGAIGAVLKTKDVKKEDAVMSLFTAGAIGMVIANTASISGAEGGCQAECGSASAMAAGAIVEMCGGTPEMVGHATAIALKCILGLVCDPVAGLVEVPCIKRNASGVSLAFTAAELALAGIKSAIPVDEVIIAMKKVGDSMPSALRETAEGGLACTATGKRLQKEIFGKTL